MASKTFPESSPGKKRKVPTPQTSWVPNKSQKMKANSLFSGRWAAAGLSESDYDDIHSKFVALDTNGDGKLSREEFRGATSLLELTCMSEENISHLFGALDADSSDFVDWEEFLYYMSLRKDHSPSALQKDAETKRLDANIKQLGFDLCVTDDGLRGVPGDGNCQFFALSWKLKKTMVQAGDIRARILEEMRKPARYDNLKILFAEIRDPSKPKSVDRYLKKMEVNCEWGDEITLQVAADLFATQINLLTSAPYDPSIPPCEGGAYGAIQIIKPSSEIRETIWLAFAADHYSPIDLTDATPNELKQLRHDH